LVDPVEIELPQEGGNNQISVNNVSEEYLRMVKHPAYKNSTIVQNAAVASRLIVTGSNYLARAMTSGADNFTQKTKPNPKPMTFTDTTHARVRKINNFSLGAAGLSAKTVGQVGKYAQNIGATLARKGEKERRAKGFDKDGNPISDYKPGVLNKSMMAFSTILDGVDYSARTLLQSGSTAATQVVGHRYGQEARTVAAGLAGGAKNVGLVYIDAAGVSRKAVIKSVAKGMVVGKMPNGNNLVVGNEDGGSVPGDVIPGGDMKKTYSNQDLPGTGQPGVGTPGVGEVGYGNRAPPSYTSGVGEPLGSTALQGQYAPSKR
jgi:spartin